MCLLDILVYMNRRHGLTHRWLQPVLEGDGLLQRLREDGDSDEELDSFDLCQEEVRVECVEL